MILEKIKSNPKLEEILQNFIDVLRINIFIVDTQGNPVLIPHTSGYGFPGSCQWGVLQHLGKPSLLSKFKKNNSYSSHTDLFGFQTFTIPIGTINPIAYLIVGPVIPNKPLEQAKYEDICKKMHLDFNKFLESFIEIRHISFNSLRLTLNLLFELSQYSLEVNKNQETKEDIVIKSSSHFLFSTLLDLAMALTQAECGSIMLFNKKTKELSIQVSKGLNPEKLQNVHIKLGQGIAGLAAQKKTSFVINEEESNNRIKHLLKKPELKCAVVLPIINNKEVVGVMNISTHNSSARLATHSQEMLKSLTRITTNTMEQALI